MNHFYNIGCPKHPLETPSVKQRRTRNSFWSRCLSSLRYLFNENRGTHPDHILSFIIFCLLAIGIIMVYSASNIISYDQYNQDSYHFLRQQLYACVLGLMGMFIAARLQYRHYRRLSKPFLGLALLLLILVYTPLGLTVRNIDTGKEYHRWLRIFGVSFQPVEFVKLALIIYVADFLGRRLNHIRSLSKGILPSVLVLGVFFMLIYRQPDFGSALLISMVVLVMLFIGGARMSQIALVGIVAGFFMYLMVKNDADYKLDRLLAFFYSDTPSQVDKALSALSIGGLTGTGFGSSLYKLYRLPFAHTDFIFAVIGEELGFVGTASILVLYMLLIWRSMHIAMRAKDTFGSSLAVGISALFGFQTLVNVGVVTRMLPTKGITLPFISCGGSSLMMNLILIGVLLSVSRSDSSPTTYPVWKR